MKINEARYTKKFNTGNYESEEYSLSAAVDDGESSQEVFARLKGEVMAAHTGKAIEATDENVNKELKAQAKAAKAKDKPAKEEKVEKTKPKAVKPSKPGKEEEIEEDDTDLEDIEDDEQEEEPAKPKAGHKSKGKATPEEADDIVDDEEEDDLEEEAEEDDDFAEVAKPKKAAAKKPVKKEAEPEEDEGDESEDEEDGEEEVATPAAKKKFKAKPQSYDRSLDAHKEIFAELLEEISPKWNKNDVTKQKAKKASVGLTGQEFLDEAGEVLPPFKIALKKAMK